MNLFGFISITLLSLAGSIHPHPHVDFHKPIDLNRCYAPEENDWEESFQLPNQVCVLSIQMHKKVSDDEDSVHELIIRYTWDGLTQVKRLEFETPFLHHGHSVSLSSYSVKSDEPLNYGDEVRNDVDVEFVFKYSEAYRGIAFEKLYFIHSHRYFPWRKPPTPLTMRYIEYVREGEDDQ